MTTERGVTANPAMAGGKAKLRLRQIGSPIGRPEAQRATLISLGLNKLGRVRFVEDTPANRGRVARVHHLLEVEPVAAE